MSKTKNTLPPYEHYFSAQSLRRAYEYVDYVENVHLSQNSVSCKVEGSYPYKVKIAWNDDDYTELSCTCPYDYEGYCKHIAAVLMYLEEELPEESITPQKQQKPEWRKIIEKLPKEELLSLIIEYAYDDENLINTILVKYSSSSNKVDIHKYKRIVDNIFNAVSDDYGFIHHQDVYGVSHLISNLLDKAKSGAENGQLQEAFSISAAIAEVCVDYIQNLDDSSGWIGGLIYDTFVSVKDVFYRSKDEALKNVIFEWLGQQMSNEAYSDYGCDEALATTYFELGSNEPYAKSVFRFIDEQLAKHEKGSDWNSKYRYSYFLNEKLTLLKKAGKKQEVEATIEQNLHLSDFRKMKVNQLIEQKDFSTAITLIKEGIVISEQENLAGVTRDWNNLLLQIYREQNLEKEFQTLSRRMFLRHPDSMEYYRMFKITVDKAEWNAERTRIIDKLKKGTKTNAWFYHFPYNLANIYIEEKMWAELFTEVKNANNISVTSQYAKYLKKDFSAELIEMYRDSILKYAQNTGRNIYEDVKRYLKEMGGLENGLPKAKALKEELLASYKNRRAMKEVLEPLFR